MGLQPGNQILVEGLQPGCGQVDQKILTIKMATKIRSLFLMVQIFFNIFSFQWQLNLGHGITSSDQI
jgi:hypothetical protein